MLMNMRKSRKAFYIEYACTIFLLLLLAAFYINGTPLRPFLRNFLLIVAAVCFLAPEIARIMTRYKITDEKIIIVHGFIKQDKKNVYFHPLAFVPDLNIKQGRIQRFLGIGTVYLKSGGAENTFEIKDVNHPAKVLELIENLIDDNKELKKNTKK